MNLVEAQAYKKGYVWVGLQKEVPSAYIIITSLPKCILIRGLRICYMSSKSHFIYFRSFYKSTTYTTSAETNRKCQDSV